ncbi:MAG: hypothetical protein JRH08_07295 [Deltaproteobacteria bacterium]|nr:hypothetical protein [Deltaproteobacteria bacterium]MBW2026359.1 hypothetical protein [Deltaproteobacteria bacterium]MBW2125495.1 hypothetical protein [Deltaproteobacteria bacterium]
MDNITHELIEELTQQFLDSGRKIIKLPPDPQLDNQPRPVQWETDGLNRIGWIYISEIIEEIRGREKDA